MRVTFVLPTGGSRPVGGFKVVYEYANGLVARGHRVTVVHAASMPERPADVSARELVLGWAAQGVLGSWRPGRWFAADPRVRMRWVPWLHPSLAPDADAIFATSWRTAEVIARWPESKGRKHYLIQHLETWDGPADRVLSTWRLPLEKVVIARWLEATAHELGERCHYVPNGLRFESFGVDRPPASRPAASAAMLHHAYAWKGSRDGLAALRLARARLPGLRAELFGTSGAPAGLPDWISYHENPTQQELRAIYNRAAIFVAPSWSEGWALPPCEALLCGCALVCTDIGGHGHCAIDGTTALTSPAKDPEALARNLVRVAADDALRSRLSEQGGAHVRQFTWDRAVDGLEAVLSSSGARAATGRDGGAPRHGGAVRAEPRPGVAP